MKKIFVLVLALSIGSISVSCKKELTKVGNAVLNNSVDSNEANAIIDFNNNFLDSYEKSSDHVNKVLEYADAAVVKSKGGNVLMMPLVIGIVDIAINKMAGVPSGFENKAEIEVDFKNYKEKRASIDSKYEELKSYITAEDFKDDNGAKAEALKKEIDAEAQAFFTSGQNIINKIKPGTDAAEEIVLKDHPLKDYIISSKKIIQSLDVTFNTLNKQYNGKFNEAEAQKKYDELAKLVENNNKLIFDVKDPQYSHKKISFESINKNANAFLDVFRKVIRDAKASGQITDNDISQLNSSYDSVLDSYNSFVN